MLACSSTPAPTSPAAPCISLSNSTLLVGADLHAAHFNSATTGCSFVPLHVLAETEITGIPHPEEPGSYVVKMTCSKPLQTTIIPDIIRVGCGTGFRLSNGTCIRVRDACALDELDIGDECLEVPELGLEYEAEAVFVTMLGDGSVTDIPIIFERAGDVELLWNLTCPNTTWLTCSSPATGLLSSGQSRQKLLIRLNADSQADYSIDGDLTADVTLETYIAVRPELPFEGRRLGMRVRARVLASVCIQEQDISVLVNDEVVSLANSSGRLGLDVVAGSVIRVQLRTFDCGRSPIQRHQAIYVSIRRAGVNHEAGITSDTKGFVYLGDGMFEMTVPTSLVGSEGELLLLVWTNSSGSSSGYGQDSIELKLSLVSSHFPVKLFFIGLIGTGIGLLLAFLLFLLCKNREHAKQLAKAFILFEMLLAVSLRLLSAPSVCPW
jgi:hypothetical protein